MAPPLDRAWLAAHPLPDLAGAVDKNGRGQVIVVGGSMHVPAAPMLTGEAAFRAGAGRVRIATVADAAMALGVAMPEAGVIALPTGRKGELARKAAGFILPLLGHSDALVLGPGMGDRAAAARLTERLLAMPRDGLSIVLDAAAVACAGHLAELTGRHGGRIVMTPHPGEMADLIGSDAETVCADLEGVAIAAARRFGAMVALKSVRTAIADPDGALLLYPGGGVGLATGGSGDTLAGIIGGLLARGASPLVATAWGVWLHGEAGRRLGPVGFLARELLALIPALIDQESAGTSS